MTEVLEPEVDVVFTPEVYVGVEGAHIIFPWVEVGEKALALCGKKHKVQIEWADIPDGYPICRECVNVAVALLSDASQRDRQALMLTLDMTLAAQALGDHLTQQSALSAVVEEGLAYQDDRAEKAIAKAAAKAESGKKGGKKKKK